MFVCSGRFQFEREALNIITQYIPMLDSQTYQSVQKMSPPLRVFEKFRVHRKKYIDNSHFKPKPVSSQFHFLEKRQILPNIFCVNADGQYFRTSSYDVLLNIGLPHKFLACLCIYSLFKSNRKMLPNHAFIFRQ